MDLKQLEYMVAIADNGNISQAAKALFITPSGLNQQLIKLEKELGLTLFVRNKHYLHLTEAGRIYIKNAREILNIRKRTYSQLDDLKANTTGEIRLGLTLEHGIDLFTTIYPRFNQRYPGIVFCLREAFVAQQLNLITSGELDMGIVLMNTPRQINNITYIPIFQEELLLGVEKSHPLAASFHVHDGILPSARLEDFQEERFSLMRKDSTMREIIDPYFEAADFQPKILIETGMNHVLARLVSNNLCCTIIPHSCAKNSPYWKNIAWFRLTPPLLWNIYLALPKDTHLNQASRYLIDLILEYGQRMEYELRQND